MSDVPEGWCWRLRLTLPTCFRYRGHKPRLLRPEFYNQEEAIDFMEEVWHNHRELALELGKSWEGGELELVLTPLPDLGARAEEECEEKVAAGWSYEEVYGTAPPETCTAEGCNDTVPAGTGTMEVLRASWRHRPYYWED